MPTTQIDLSRQAKDLSLTNSKIANGAITNEKIQDGSIDNAKISATAAIVYSKLSIADGDISIAKLNTTSADFDSSGLLKTGVVGDNEVDAISISKITDLGTTLSGLLKIDGTRAMTGALNMNSHKISNLTAGTENGDAINKYQLDTAIAGVQSTIQKFTWLNSVKDATNTPPSSPSEGDRYLVTAVASGDWEGHEKDIAEWDGSQWVFTLHSSLDTGTFLSVNTVADRLYMWDGSDWTLKYFETTTASTGLTKVGFDIRLDSSAAGDGLVFSSGVLAVGAGTGISVSSDAVAVDVGYTENKIPQYDGSGNLAIGKASASYKLDVSGTIASSGNIMLTGSSDQGLSVSSNSAGIKYNRTSSNWQISHNGTNFFDLLPFYKNKFVTEDDSTTEFELTYTPRTGTTQVYVNGVLLSESHDYTVSNNVVTLGSAPDTASIVQIIYQIGTNS